MGTAAQAAGGPSHAVSLETDLGGQQGCGAGGAQQQEQQQGGGGLQKNLRARALDRLQQRLATSIQGQGAGQPVASSGKLPAVRAITAVETVGESLALQQPSGPSHLPQDPATLAPMVPRAVAQSTPALTPMVPRAAAHSTTALHRTNQVTGSAQIPTRRHSLPSPRALPTAPSALAPSHPSAQTSARAPTFAFPSTSSPGYIPGLSLRAELLSEPPDLAQLRLKLKAQLRALDTGALKDCRGHH